FTGSTAAEMNASRREGSEARSDPGPYERERWRGPATPVQADEQPCVGDHPVGVREGVGRGRLNETQPLVELDGAAHLLHRDAELVERPRQRLRCVGHQAGVPCAAPGRCSRSPSVHPWQRWAIKSARAWACPGLTLRAGTDSK